MKFLYISLIVDNLGLIICSIPINSSKCTFFVKSTGTPKNIWYLRSDLTNLTAIVLHIVKSDVALPISRDV